jgi:hypothetical protein
VTQRDDLRREDILPGQHRGVSACGRDIGAEGLLEERALFGELVDVRRRQAMIAVAAHVVAAQRVDAQQNDIRFLLTASRHSGFLCW